MSDIQVGFPSPQPVMSPPATGQYLSNEDFDSLLKSAQLLRISQLRYIVQKFQIPASGNKTKLLNLIISIFHSIRYDPVLIDIFAEINSLIAQQNEPFQNPLLNVMKLELVPPNPMFFAPPNPLFNISESAYIFGPILASPGKSMGSFQFLSPPTTNQVVVDFLFQGGLQTPFSISMSLNGIAFEISQDDPFPSLFDVTSVMNKAMNFNVIDFKMIQCTAPIMIVLRECVFVGLGHIVNQILGREVDVAHEDPLVVGQNCQPHQGFSLMSFLSKAIALDNWYCPICQAPIEIVKLREVNEAAPVPVPQHQQVHQQIAESQSMVDSHEPIFKVEGFDWDAF